MHLLKVKKVQQIIKEQGNVPHHDTKSTQSGELRHQATPTYQRVITGLYNPSEEVANIYKLDTTYFIKYKISVNRVNSNTIISALEARSGKRRT